MAILEQTDEAAVVRAYRVARARRERTGLRGLRALLRLSSRKELQSGDVDASLLVGRTPLERTAALRARLAPAPSTAWWLSGGLIAPAVGDTNGDPTTRQPHRR
jgi:hypothetical protein